MLHSRGSWRASAKSWVYSALVYALVKRGEIPHVRVSNAIRIHPDDFAAYMARNRS